MNLFEARSFEYQILEDRGPGQKMIVGGIFQKVDEVNANGRIYPKDLWSRVLEDAKVQNRIRERRMMGELDHPAEGKTSLHRVSHIVTEVKLDPDGYVRGKYEVLNTPHGRILGELHRANVKLGISSRGNGDLETKNEGGAIVIPESYKFDTFDVVPDPSVQEAFPTMVSESIIKADAEILEKITREDLKVVGEKIAEACGCKTESKTESVEAPRKEESTMAGEVNQVTEQGLAEKLTAALDELQEKKEQLEAASKIIEELALREKTARFNARVFREQIELLKPLESRYGAAKEIINEFYHRAQKTQGIRERYRALLKVTEQLVEFVDALKIARQIGRVLANESEDRKALLKPILASCTSAEEVKTKYGQITESLKKVIPITKETAPTTRRGGLYETVLPTKDTVKNGKGGTPVKETKAPDNGNLTEEDYQVAMAHRISEKMRVG